MKTLLVTGGIGSGKSEVCRYLESLGVPVYDSDSRTKSLYDRVPGLPARVDAALGGGMLREDGSLDRKALAAAVFTDGSKLRTLESIVHPEVLADFCRWRDSQTAEAVVMESAIALNLTLFHGFFDGVILVDAPLALRVERACRRDASTREAVMDRISKQSFDPSRADVVIVNDSDVEELRRRTDKALEKLVYLQVNHKEQTMKTDLSRILAVSGQHGLYQYIAQGRNGVIAECLADKKRVSFDLRSRITTLADIAIFTSEGELKLKDVFTAMHDALGEADAPSSKAPADQIKAVFVKAVPDYDEDRFYISHMKKVVDWYNDLKNNASLEFVEEEDAEAEAETEEASEDAANA